MSSSIGALLCLFMALGLPLVVPTIQLLVESARSLAAWPEHSYQIEHVQQVGDGAFRAAEARSYETREVAVGAPFGIKAAAWISFFAGQMIIPGIGAAIVGALVSVASIKLMGLLALVPFLAIVAVCVYSASLQWSLGNSMLRGNFQESARLNKKVIAYTLGINIPTIVAAVVASAVMRVPAIALGWSAYPVLSILIALGVSRQLRAHKDAFAKVEATMRAPVSNVEPLIAGATEALSERVRVDASEPVAEQENEDVIARADEDKRGAV